MQAQYSLGLSFFLSGIAALPCALLECSLLPWQEDRPPPPPLDGVLMVCLPTTCMASGLRYRAGRQRSPVHTRHPPPQPCGRGSKGEEGPAGQPGLLAGGHTIETGPVTPCCFGLPR